jgi:hypothetical protein
MHLGGQLVELGELDLDFDGSTQRRDQPGEPLTPHRDGDGVGGAIKPQQSRQKAKHDR